LVLFGFLLENTRLCHRKKKESEKVKGFVIYFRLYFVIATHNSKKGTVQILLMDEEGNNGYSHRRYHAIK
jgi:hypothetical protein